MNKSRDRPQSASLWNQRQEDKTQTRDHLPQARGIGIRANSLFFPPANQTSSFKHAFSSTKSATRHDLSPSFSPLSDLSKSISILGTKSPIVSCFPFSLFQDLSLSIYYLYGSYLNFLFKKDTLLNKIK